MKTRNIAPQPCIRCTRTSDANHDACMRIGGEAPGWRAHSQSRPEAMGRRGSPPPRIVIDGPSAQADGCRIYLRVSDQHYAGRRTTPCGMSPIVTNRHSAMRSLRASATTMVLRFFPAATLA
jgi:hypothetical protein